MQAEQREEARRRIFTALWIIGVTVAGVALYVGALFAYLYARIHFGFDGVSSLVTLLFLPGIVAASVGVFAWATKGRLPGTRSAKGRGFPVEQPRTILVCEVYNPDVKRVLASKPGKRKKK